MKHKLRLFHIISGILVVILGTLLHFTYDLSGNNKFVALFSAINESTWEHLKLIFFPMLITTIIGTIFFFKSSSCFWCTRLTGTLVSISFTIIFFYTYTGIIGKNIPVVDILSFFLSVFIGEFVSYALILNCISCNKKIVLVFLSVTIILFVLFTFSPPHIGLFKDPITGTYGIQKEL